MNCNFNKQENIAMFTDYPDVVSITQMAKMLSIGKVLAYRLVKDKSIYAKKIGREYKIQKSAVINYLNDMEENDERKPTN